MDADAPSQSGRRTQVVILGASNVTLGFPILLQLVEAGLANGADLYACHGHGRSYGQWSKVLFRGLPGIADSGLWQAIERVPERNTRLALLTDIGNDLVYGVRPPQIVEWVEACLQRLASTPTQTILTQLPLASLADVGSLRFRLFRAVCFPTRSVNWDRMATDIQDLSKAIRLLANQYGARLIEPPRDWFGLDPIHIRSDHRVGAWQRILSEWDAFEPPEGLHRPGFVRWAASLRYRPHHWRLAGWDRGSEQPCLRTGNLSVHLY